MAVDAIWSGTPRFCARSREILRSLCIVEMWLPVPSNFLSIIFSRDVLVIPQPAPEEEKTLSSTSPFIPAFAASTEASNVAEKIEPIVIAGKP